MIVHNLSCESNYNFAVNGTWLVRKIYGAKHGCYGHVAVYEPLTNHIIGHGGYSGIIMDDTWMYNPDKQTLYV